MSELREIVEAAELAYREYGLGKPPDDQMLEARERFEEAFNPNRVSKMLDVIATIDRRHWWHGNIHDATYREEHIRASGCPLCDALAALDASSSVTEGRTKT